MRLGCHYEAEEGVVELSFYSEAGCFTASCSPLIWRPWLKEWMLAYDPPVIPREIRMWMMNLGPVGLIWVPAHDVCVWLPAEWR